MASGIRVTGLRETISKLSKFGVSTADLKESMTRVGQIVANEIKSIVPTRTGALANSVRPSKAKNKAIVRAGSAKVNYAVYQDKGFRGVPGKQFMERGLEAKRAEVLDTFEDEIRNLIKRYGL